LVTAVGRWSRRPPVSTLQAKAESGSARFDELTSPASPTIQYMNFHQQVYLLTKKIPRGKVTTYGQIAAIISSPRAARMVGWALHQLDNQPDVPWHRVINSKGYISTTCETHTADLQASILRKEGISQNKMNNLMYI